MLTRLSLRRRFATGRSVSFEYLETRIYLDGHGVVEPCLLEPGEGDTARAAHAINCFAIDLYEHMQNEKGNLFLSPTSIATALAMTYAGAAGQTAEEIEQVFHFGAEPGIHSSFRELISSFESPMGVGDNFKLELANAMWPAIGFQLRDEYVQTIETEYQGETQSLDYSDTELAKETINSWVEDKTNGRVKDLLQRLDPATVMVLTNSIYFNASWQNKFDPTFTEINDPTFYLENGETINTPMMVTEAGFHYTELDGFQVLEMPYEGGSTSMIVALPLERGGSNELTPELLVGIDDWIEGPREAEEVHVTFPKFETAVGADLDRVLSEMGMPSAFWSADFSKMVDGGGIAIDQVRHKASIEFTEEGTEAGAGTAVAFIICFAKGTPVLTPDGEKPIEKLKAGDYVLSRNEHNVEGKIEQKLVEETFHGHAEIFNLRVGGQTIRVTDAHPFFVKEQGWTPACELRSGDLLATDLSSWMEVEGISTTGQAEPVYNFRVADHHTYFVGGEAWGFAVWVHNEYVQAFHADHPFHFFIRDNTSSSLLFMGRIDDPTQAENELEPKVAPIAGDSNRDGRFDSSDLVFVFQAGKYEDGIANNANFAEGDWNGDGDFNSRDLVFAFQNSEYEGAVAASLSLRKAAANTLFALDDDDHDRRFIGKDISVVETLDAAFESLV